MPLYLQLSVDPQYTIKDQYNHWSIQSNRIQKTWHGKTDCQMWGSQSQMSVSCIKGEPQTFQSFCTESFTFTSECGQKTEKWGILWKYVITFYTGKTKRDRFIAFSSCFIVLSVGKMVINPHPVVKKLYLNLVLWGPRGPRQLFWVKQPWLPLWNFVSISWL